MLMTPKEADEAAQNWRGMDGATAWHLIDRHADNWAEVGEMMDAWLRANTTPLPPNATSHRSAACGASAGLTG